MKTFSLLCATTALLSPALAMAQSTGTVAFEEDEIVVTGQREENGVQGIVIPDTPKAKAVLTEEIIRRQTPGQTILDTINLVPGVSFQNNDPYGSSGGTLTIRGFDSTRISLTFDGIPLNDSGNYAIYSNQQLDPEIIEQVNVNLGVTDVDSPTASAVGGTVNYLSRIPGEDVGAMVAASIGEYDYHRVFGMIDTGNLTAFGTRAFVAASYATNDHPFNNYGKIEKQQYNAKLYQPIGVNGDFISIAGHYNENRNNFGGSVALRTDREPPSGFPATEGERFYDIAYPCLVDTPEANVADVPNSCGTEFDRRYNPSNTGNIRVNSRFTLADGLVLTVDPSFQYVKANGGGTNGAFEHGYIGDPDDPLNGQLGYIGGDPYVGIDLNGDGDLLDEVTVLQPSQTQTDRYGVLASLIYDINDANRVRLAYTFDRARHRQTGQVGFVGVNGEPDDVFPVNDPIIDANGNVLQKRDRLSYAILHQISADYRGQFLDDRLTVLLGVRAPFFKRELNQHCFTTSASGFVDCFGQDPEANADYAAARPGVSPPQSRDYKYDKLLPNVGFTFDLGRGLGLFAGYAKGISVPGTDPLYDSLFFDDPDSARPVPETTDSFDVGLRYTSGRLQAQLAGWFTRYENRLATAYDPVLDETIFRNLGQVDKYGIDASIAYEPIDDWLVYVFGSYLKSEIKDDLQVDIDADGNPIFADTSGKRESGSPVYMLGARVQGTIGPVQLGAQIKRTGKRYVNDENLPIARDGVQLFDASVPAYTLVDLDARFSLADFGLEETYVQLNVTNLFDKRYVGGFGGSAQRTDIPFVQIGAPRAVSGSLVVAF